MFANQTSAGGSRSGQRGGPSVSALIATVFVISAAAPARAALMETGAGDAAAGLCNIFDPCGDSDCDTAYKCSVGCFGNPLCAPQCGGNPCVCNPCGSGCNPVCNPLCPQYSICGCHGRCSVLCPTAACDAACVNPTCVPVCPQFNLCACANDPCNPACPQFDPCRCVSADPCLCNPCGPTCGAACNPLCGGDLCANGCPNECSALCLGNLACDPVCGGDPCSDACAATLNFDLFCSAQLCPTNDRCNLACGGDPCASGCPDACSVLCLGNLACNRACGGDPCSEACAATLNFHLFCSAQLCPTNDRCNLACGGDPCASGCPDACSVLCLGNLACDPACGGDPCSDACAATLNFELFCSEQLCPINDRCNLVCGGDPCASGCPDACTALCVENLACLPQCGGDPCSAACAATLQFHLFCDEFICPANAECNLVCGGNPCDPNCPDACTAFCVENLACLPQCGGDPCSAACAATLNFGLFCDEHLCPANARCNLVCGGDICDAGCPDRCNEILCAGVGDCLPECGHDPCAADCAIESYCDPVLCPINAACDPDCGGDPCVCNPCAAECPDEPDCDGDQISDACEVRRRDQWASYVIDYTTQYSSGGWSAAQALGAPNTLNYCDCSTAWAPLEADAHIEQLAVGFTRHDRAFGVRIRQTLGTGFVTRVDLIREQGDEQTVWSDLDPSPSGEVAELIVAFKPTTFEVKGVRIFVDTNHSPGNWEEIDAIQLLSQAAGESADLNADGVPDSCQRGDCTGDQSFSLSDMPCAARCVRGPGSGLTGGCVLFDFDRDYDVDLRDQAVMERVLSTQP